MSESITLWLKVKLGKLWMQRKIEKRWTAQTISGIKRLAVCEDNKQGEDVQRKCMNRSTDFARQLVPKLFAHIYGDMHCC